VLLLAFFVGVLFAQDAPEPYPGQSEHREPPVGWFCWPAQNAEHLKTEAHACDCRGMVEDKDPMCTTQGEDEDGNPIEVPLGESAKCKAWCHKSHCTCARLCKDTDN
jgi:hypothetical protein